VEKTETDAKINITDPEQLKSFLDEERRMLADMVEQVKRVGANVVLCQKGIDDVAQHYLAKAGILAVRRVKESDMQKLAEATGGRVVMSLKDLSPSDLGTAELVEERKVAGEEMVFVGGVQGSQGRYHPGEGWNRARGGRAGEGGARRGFRGLRHPGGREDPAGGGACEMELAKELRDFSRELGGREALAVNAFAEALEIIPRTLAEERGPRSRRHPGEAARGA